MIYVCHGVVSHKDNSLISHALFADESAFCEYLSSLPSCFVTLDQAMAGAGDALTVDDATYAGFRAVTLARQMGHAVSWCVNGEEVVEGLPYFPFQISCMLDQTSKKSCFFLGCRWDLSTLEHRRSFRFYLKQEYLRCDSRRAIDAFVSALAAALQINVEMPKALRTVDRTEIETAVFGGCRLLNHGWTHLNPNAYLHSDLEADIARNAVWLRSFQCEPSSIYVPPYGRAVPHAKTMDLTVLLADRTLGSDHGAHAINRKDLYCESDTREQPAPITLEAAA
jgi:hypothetical protein